MKTKSRSNPVLRLLVVDAARNIPVRTTSVVVTLARMAKGICPNEALEEGRKRIALPLESGKGNELRTDHETGIATIKLDILERRSGLSLPNSPPDWSEGWLARVMVWVDGYLPTRTEWIRAPMCEDDEPHRVDLSWTDHQAATVLHEMIRTGRVPTDSREVGAFCASVTMAQFGLRVVGSRAPEECSLDELTIAIVEGGRALKKAQSSNDGSDAPAHQPHHVPASWQRLMGIVQSIQQAARDRVAWGNGGAD